MRYTPRFYASFLLHILFIYDVIYFPQVPLNDYFPEYTGGTDADEGARCILTRFRELNYFPLQVYSQ